MTLEPKTILITGAGGLLGFHCHALLLALNGERAFKEEAPAFIIRTASRHDFANAKVLSNLVKDCDIVLHLAGINRSTTLDVKQGNLDIAQTLVAALEDSSSTAHVVYTNSTHSTSESPYGQGKRLAGECLEKWAKRNDANFTNVVLPHLFGEGGIPNYNTVTATLCEHVISGTLPDIHSGASVELMHTGDTAQLLLDAGLSDSGGNLAPKGLPIMVEELYARFIEFKTQWDTDLFPALSDPLTLRLYNTFRYSMYSRETSRVLDIKEDVRGTLFEVARGGGGGQTFLSWTKPGVERGNHFHRWKVERFVVLQGQADIHIRKILSDDVKTISVTGLEPIAVDMPTLHTHSICNTGTDMLLTLFWAHEVFDPSFPDTYMEKVLPSKDSKI